MRRLILPLCALAAVAAPVATIPVVAWAIQEPRSGEVARLQAEYRDEQVRARRLRTQATEAAAESVELERELSRLRAVLGSEDARIVAQRQRLRTLQAQEATLIAELSRTRVREGRLLSALQMMSRRPPPPLLVPADRAVDTVRASILMRAIAPDIRREARAITTRREEVGRVRRLAALNSEALFTAESAQGNRRAEIESLTARKAALGTVLRAEAQAAERAANVLEARLRALGASIPTTDASSSAPVARLPAGRSRLTAPIAAAPAQRYGRGATGWRWRADEAEARAPANARVVHAGPLSGWGEVVILDLGPGWRAIVSGMDSLSVQTGDTVSDGQTLGRTGADGELYFELRRDERPIDPGPWLE
ncbi:MAG: peptidoglycan DD-metalloendopeptidase family protein [Brevundimonas sp.]|uniref:murein hydrolase activator EnvC family protein n=1 Tax=Brevundimonas sp. TaxID=1871086 RepID=UPI001A2DD8EE|nr:peptidoglycan DD-metalloendopeptidase family protein [Brevundimonas sp.]MBJ7448096.1 peptidoglycan DD-metalloendopeptidase family protein [Brevundimonas sp.]